MKLIVGLGNPGSKYSETLHNVGFRALDHLAESLSLPDWKSQYKGLITCGSLGGESFVLLKPQTYMNLSGESVLACKQFFKIDLEDMIVVSDDIDLEPGNLRYRVKGGHGGQNGLRNIIQLCGGSNFHRLRVGIGRPFGKKDVAAHVLSKGPAEVQTAVEDSLEESVKYLENFIRNVPIQISPKK